MKSCISIWLSFVFMLLISSCKEIIEPSITTRAVTVQAPSNGYQTPVYNVGFWWDEVEDALSYRLQIVTPSFESPGKLVQDTLVKGHVFSVNIDPGKYEWRLRAENGSSVTEYSRARSFTVLQSSIKQQSVQLSAPANNLLTNDGAIIFKWSDLYGATRYQLQVDTNGFADENFLVLKTTVSTQQFQLTLSKDQVYQWRVRAENDTAQSKWSGSNQITYDHTPPKKVLLTLPADKGNISNPVSIKWAASAGASKYRLYLLKQDGASPYNDTFPISLNTNSYAFTAGSSGETIYWKVVAVDAAGNESEVSDTRSFSIL
jgi:uncharacterized protein YegP (UPF0339 family)